MGAAGAIFGGLSASAAMRKMRKSIEAQRKKNQDWYDQRYNEDSTQRADAQRMLTMTEESIRQRNQQVAGAQAVTGGTDEALAASKEANNKALADAASQIAAAGDARKDQIESTYQQKDDQYAQQLQNLQQQKAATISQAVQGVTSAAGELPF